MGSITSAYKQLDEEVLERSSLCQRGISRKFFDVVSALKCSIPKIGDIYTHYQDRQDSGRPPAFPHWQNGHILTDNSI